MVSVTDENYWMLVETPDRFQAWGSLSIFFSALLCLFRDFLAVSSHFSGSVWQCWGSPRQLRFHARITRLSHCSGIFLLLFKNYHFLEYYEQNISLNRSVIQLQGLWKSCWGLGLGRVLYRILVVFCLFSMRYYIYRWQIRQTNVFGLRV